MSCLPSVVESCGCPGLICWPQLKDARNNPAGSLWPLETGQRSRSQLSDALSLFPEKAIIFKWSLQELWQLLCEWCNGTGPKSWSCVDLKSNVRSALCDDCTVFLWRRRSSHLNHLKGNCWLLWNLFFSAPFTSIIISYHSEELLIVRNHQIVLIKLLQTGAVVVRYTLGSTINTIKVTLPRAFISVSVWQKIKWKSLRPQYLTSTSATEEIRSQSALPEEKEKENVLLPRLLTSQRK